MTYQEAIATQDAIDSGKDLGLAFSKMAATANVVSMCLVDLTQALQAFPPELR